MPKSTIGTRTKRLTSLGLIALLSLATAIPGLSVNAQPQKAPQKAPQQAGGQGGGGVIDLDAENPDKPADEEPPAVPGQPTEEAAQAKHLFETGKWAQAALALKKVTSGETGDDEGNKQLAQFQLAICLYNLNLFQASYSYFSEIAVKKNHQKFAETLLWLARLAQKLPEPANIIERVGKYDVEMLKRFDNAEQRPLYWQLNYLLGRYKYNARDFETALQLLKEVGAKSPYYVQAKFFMGITYVQLRQSVPAVQAFQDIDKALDEGVEGVEDTGRMRDLAYLSMARTYYSASVKLDSAGNPKIDEKKLSAAVKYWNRVDVSSEYWLDALFEESWAYFMAGDYPHALGNIHTLESPYFPNSFYPEAEVLKAIVYLTTCQYEDATTITAQMKLKYQPIKKDLQSILEKYSGENADEQFFDFLKKVRDGKAGLSPELEPIVHNALSDRQLLRNIEYVDQLDEERKRFNSMDSGFKGSDLGNDITDSLDLARQVAIRKAGTLARDRYQRYVDELSEHLRNAQKIIIDVTNAERGKLEEAAAGRMTKEESDVYGVVEQDDEHELWPFDGEYWRDELGFYRQVVVSKCKK